MLAICIFAMAFIFFYEARGVRLVQFGGDSDVVGGVALETHFWHQVFVGGFVLALGVVLLAVLRRPGQTDARWTAAECWAYALAMGILIGTALVSWFRVHQAIG